MWAVHRRGVIPKLAVLFVNLHAVIVHTDSAPTKLQLRILVTEFPHLVVITNEFQRHSVGVHFYDTDLHAVEQRTHSQQLFYGNVDAVCENFQIHVPIAAPLGRQVHLLEELARAHGGPVLLTDLIHADATGFYGLAKSVFTIAEERSEKKLEVL